MKCILHIGGAKTGTTSLQMFLAMNRDRLQDMGIHYPGPKAAHHFLSLPYKGGNQNYVRHLGLKTQSEIEDHYSKYWLAAQIERPPEHAHTLLLSSESLGTLGYANWMHLLDKLKPFYQEFKAILYLRRPDYWSRSFWISLHRDGQIPAFTPPPWKQREHMQICLNVLGA